MHLPQAYYNSPPFLFLLIPPPPRSTLFPYTTLFRSNHGLTRPPELEGEATSRAITLAKVMAREVASDRKSTRLNSSHPSISYAVFCLKKKKHDRLRPDPTTQRALHAARLAIPQPLSI